MPPVATEFEPVTAAPEARLTVDGIITKPSVFRDVLKYTSPVDKLKCVLISSCFRTSRDKVFFVPPV